MADSALAVIEGIVSRLNTYTPVNDLLLGAVYTDVPQQSKPPYAVLSIDSDDWSTKSSSDMSHVLRVQVFSNKKGIKQALTIRSAIVDALDRQEASVTLSSGTVMLMQKGGLNTAFKEPDGKTWQSVVQFNIIVQS
tara:strand:- start:1303 stop:1710 length:408 start_codon:yes stop_codon:yes gene_type:complete